MKPNPNSWTNRVARRLDDAIAIIAPYTAARRRALRAANQIQWRTAHRGASRDRLRRGWMPTGGSADADLLTDLPELRNRSRDLVANDGHAAAFIQTMAVNIVGTGIRPQSRIEAAAIGKDEQAANDLQDAAESAWARWTPHADAGGRLNWTDMLDQVCRQILTNGEVFLLRQRLDRPRYPLAFQIIEADRIDTPPELRSNGHIRAGIELGAHGQATAYYVRRTHPGETSVTDPELRRYDRIPALDQDGRPNMLHLFRQERPGQTRGCPILAPVLPLFRDLQEYMEAEVVAARVAACFSVFIRRPNAYDAALSRGETIAGQRRETLEPGIIEYLDDGEDISTFNPQRPAATFDAFVMRILRTIGAPAGLSYETMTKDFSQSNYSSARAALLEARRHFRVWQTWLATHLCQPIWEMVIEEAYLAGDLDADYYSNPEAYQAVRWILPGWDWLDPQKEVTASTTSVNNYLSTLADECAARGGDWQANLEQAAREARYRQYLGLPEPATDRAEPPTQEEHQQEAK